MGKETINVVITADNNYAQPLGVTVYSLLDNFASDNHRIKITVLDGGITEENKSKLYTICEKFNTEIIFIRMSNTDFDGFPVIGRFPKTIYYRIFIPNKLGHEVKKALYLDCDILVIGNIAPLYETNIDEYHVAAIEDFVGKEHIASSTALFSKQIKKMFNAGVILMNLEKMRGDNFVERACEFVKNNADNLPLLDQDALNFMCRDSWLPVNKVWNYQIDISQGRIDPSPVILHYTNSYKPWNAFYNNYYQKDYVRYLKKSWPNYIIKPVSFKVTVKQLLKYIPFSVYLVRNIKKTLEK